MRLLIVAVGTWKACPERELFEEYRRRLPWTLDLAEISVKTGDPAAMRRAEGEKLLAASARAKAATLVALDAGGVMLSSEELAARLGRWRDEGASPVAFLIGGHSGLSDEAKKKADLVLALGRVTWPHLLMRSLLAEQLYRSWTILAGHPYHRG